ncbi:MAG TPA: ATP phosphoribosyltransferase, partial [Candidatus Micrarchaeota archaeon]|nr:ATP phosphoribosyltransferase [Candidatus Micrarchaeota archaeon]
NGALKIAVPNKGRLKMPALELLGKCQIRVEIAEDERRLWAETSDPQACVVFARAEDIPDIVASGAADCGITGLDLVVEKKANATVLQNLGFGKCRVAIAGPKGSKLAMLSGSRIATKTPNLLATYLKRNKIRAKPVMVKGATELSPMLGISEFICDHVSTGSTLAANALFEIDTVFESEACFVSAPELGAEKKTLVESLASLISGTLAAGGKKYLMMNVDERNLKRLTTSIPSAKSPTVLQLAKKGQFAVHTVVPAQGLAGLIRRLKELGARDILVLGINQVIA